MRRRPVTLFSKQFVIISRNNIFIRIYVTLAIKTLRYVCLDNVEVFTVWVLSFCISYCKPVSTQRWGQWVSISQIVERHKIEARNLLGSKILDQPLSRGVKDSYKSLRKYWVNDKTQLRCVGLRGIERRFDHNHYKNNECEVLILNFLTPAKKSYAQTQVKQSYSWANQRRQPNSGYI